MSCALTQQICEELGSRDGIGSALREATPLCQQPASSCHTLQSSPSKLLANQVDFRRIADTSGQIISIYADTIQHKDLSIPNYETAIPVQTALELSTGLSQVLLKLAEIGLPYSRYGTTAPRD